MFEQAVHAIELDMGLELAAGTETEFLQAEKVLAELRGGTLGR
jgi:hypothetical protein